MNHKDTEVPNLHAWVLMRSLKSKGVVEEVFNWRHHYFYVKSEGLKVLRDALGIVEENVVPITFKKTLHRIIRLGVIYGNWRVR